MIRVLADRRDRRVALGIYVFAVLFLTATLAFAISLGAAPTFHRGAPCDRACVLAHATDRGGG